MTQDPQTALLQSEISLLKEQRGHLLAALANISNTLAHHPETRKGNTLVHFAYQRALGAVHQVVEG